MLDCINQMRSIATSCSIRYRIGIVAALAFSIFYFLYRGVFRAWGGMVDFETFYYGTRAWIISQNPYNYEIVFNLAGRPEGTFARVINIPSFFILNTPFSIFQYRASEVIFLMVNVVALVVVFYYLYKDYEFHKSKNFVVLLLPPIVLSLASVHSSLYQGQHSILALLFLLIGIRGLNKKALLFPSASLVFAASMRPQLLIFIPFLLLFFGYIKQFLLAGFIFTLLTLAAIFHMGLDSLDDLIRNINLFNNQEFISIDMSGAGNVYAMGSGAYVITDLRKLFYDLFGINYSLGLVRAFAVLSLFYILYVSKISGHMNMRKIHAVSLFCLLSALLFFYNRYYNSVVIIIFFFYAVDLYIRDIKWPLYLSLFLLPFVIFPIFSIVNKMNIINNDVMYFIFLPSYNYALVVMWLTVAISLKNHFNEDKSKN